MPNAIQSVPAVYAYSGLEGIEWPNTTGNVITPGQVIAMPTQQGVMYGISRQTIPAGTIGTVAIEGVFDLLLDGASTFVPGDTVYWNANANQATSDGAYSADIIGVCVEATADETDISVRTWLTSFYLR